MNSLNPRFAGAEAGQFQQPVAGLFLFADRRDISQHMRQVLTVRVEAALPFIDHHTRQVGGIDLDPRNVFPFQVFAQRHRHERPVAPNLFQDAPTFARAHGHDLVQ